MSRLSFSPSKIALFFCAASLGSVIAWATTGVFHFAFVQGLLFGLVVSLGTTRIGGLWLWLSALMFVLFGWLTQTWTLAWEPIGSMLALTPLLLGNVSRVESILSSQKLHLVAYGILVLAVVLGGMPIWCLLALFTFPIAWQTKGISQEQRMTLALLVELFIMAGYLIKGLIR